MRAGIVSPMTHTYFIITCNCISYDVISNGEKKVWSFKDNGCAVSFGGYVKVFNLKTGKSVEALPGGVGKSLRRY